MITPQIDEPMHTRILSFDPGETTGIAFLNEGNLVWGMAAYASAFQKESFIMCLTKMVKPTGIILESMPSNGFPNQDQTFVHNFVLTWYQKAGYQIALIKPGFWKGLVPRTKMDSVDIKDAADMALWFFRKRT